MNEFHKVNRNNWNDHADDYKLRVDRQGNWDKCHLDPTNVLRPSEIEAFGDLNGKSACVLGSGNNYVTFALAGVGAHLTRSLTVGVLTGSV